MPAGCKPASHLLPHRAAQSSKVHFRTPRRPRCAGARAAAALDAAGRVRAARAPHPATQRVCHGGRQPGGGHGAGAAGGVPRAAPWRQQRPVGGQWRRGGRGAAAAGALQLGGPVWAGRAGDGLAVRATAPIPSRQGLLSFSGCLWLTRRLKLG